MNQAVDRYRAAEAELAARPARPAATALIGRLAGRRGRR
jgi:hypothetical protein